MRNVSSKLVTQKITDAVNEAMLTAADLVFIGNVKSDLADSNY